MLDWLYLALKAFISLAFMFLLYKVAIIEIRKRQLQSQGVVFLPYLPAISDMIRLLKHSADKPYPEALLATLEHSIGTCTVLPDKCGLILFGQPVVIFTKADALRDIYLNENAKITRPLSSGNEKCRFLLELGTKERSYTSMHAALQPNLIRRTITSNFQQSIISACRQALRQIKEVDGVGADRFQLADLGTDFSQRVIGQILVEVLIGGRGLVREQVKRVSDYARQVHCESELQKSPKERFKKFIYAKLGRDDKD